MADRSIAYHKQPEGMMLEIANWLYGQRGKIFAARKQKGGWEAWLQVELAIFLQINLGMTSDVYREKHVFKKSSEMIDIWCEPVKGREESLPYLGIELKVESEYQDKKAQSLQKRFEADFMKCIGGPDKQYMTWDARTQRGKRTHMYCVGLTSKMVDIVDFNKVSDHGGQVVNYYQIFADPQFDEHNLYILWWEQMFPLT